MKSSMGHVYWSKAIGVTGVIALIDLVYWKAFYWYIALGNIPFLYKPMRLRERVIPPL